MPAAAPPELVTVRDFLRYALSSFQAAKLAYGHGTTSALDEAAFLILETLHLPVHDINPWLDAKLTTAERRSLGDIIRKRIETRLPAAYLTRRTYIHGVPFYVDERVIVPRSYIGELLFSDILENLIAATESITSVLDLCTGGGSLAILAARAFPNAEIEASDLSQDALAVARINMMEHSLSNRIKLLQGDLFQAVKDSTYDFIISNPPYVSNAEVKAFPPEYAHEPEMAHLGGADGLDIVRRILAGATNHLNPGGALLCEVGEGRDILIADFPDLDFLWLDTEESEGEVFWLTREQLLECSSG
ncbi:MAG TPA: 50S ribosomal protein L3 N(5)-glutamine methyltransferase [Aestuariivirga sp.]|nr:50S ribosomal protein L3 N(5)-glutamine methyltransferase [Aestuariivirga sp.]